MIRFLYAFFCCGLSASLWAQAQPNQLIVQLRPNAGFGWDLPYLLHKEELSKSWQVFLLTINPEKADFEQILTQLQADNRLLAVQKNHQVSLRQAPNDSLYQRGNIWQSERLGLETAWAYSTGGLNGLGDSLVVAVIDNGCQLSHPDLSENIWRNRQEIPDNQTDDDQNGYIDDYLGWSVQRGSDTIFNQAHGTAVNGIIGALGDNQIGTVGINWRIKLLQLVAAEQGSTVLESNVVRAYDYIYTMRRLYDSSNGQKGAFIVATNASFGVDNGKPADFPIWCGIYDSLGSLGILSVGATSNSSKDIDINGDMPTACPSPFLIAVTAANRNEAQQGGYGEKSIDLSAPTGVWSSSNGQNYLQFGGTSAAAPHVTGALALLHSYPNPDWALAYKNEPSATALLLKQLIFQHVDKIDNLKNITSTGGRLNIGRAMEALHGRYQPATEAGILAVFPNPAHDGLWLRWGLQQAEEARLQIYSPTGQLLADYFYPADRAKTELNFIDCQSWAAGVYLLRWTAGAKTETQKFIKY